MSTPTLFVEAVDGPFQVDVAEFRIYSSGHLWVVDKKDREYLFGPAVGNYIKTHHGEQLSEFENPQTWGISEQVGDDRPGILTRLYRWIFDG